MKKISVLVSSLCMISACSTIPGKAYFNHGDPETLLDVSSEVVNLNLASQGALGQLSSMIERDPPARAELGCSASETTCAQAREILERHNIPQSSGNNAHGVTLVYERVVARDCEQRYIDNSINPYNLNHPTFGCSLAGNTVQMVSDKRQFVSPSLLDLEDGEKSVQTYRDYLNGAKSISGNSAVAGAPSAIGGR